MDLNTLRSVMTALCFLAFVGIVWWAWSAKSSRHMEEAARLPFSEDECDGEIR